MPEFNLASLIVVAAVAAVAIYAVRHLVRIGKGKDSCCSGAGGGTRTIQKTKHVEVADTDPTHYPFTTQVRVRDMVCEGCVENVQNALNALPGTWATVDLASRTATVRTKPLRTQGTASSGCRALSPKAIPRRPSFGAAFLFVGQLRHGG